MKILTPKMNKMVKDYLILKIEYEERIREIVKTQSKIAFSKIAEEVKKEKINELQKNKLEMMREKVDYDKLYVANFIKEMNIHPNGSKLEVEWLLFERRVLDYLSGEISFEEI